MEEKTKVARSAFSQTLGGEPAPSAHDDEMEPLRVPSQSPSPAPFQQSRNSSVARTILIGGAAPPPQAPAPKPAARPAAASSAPKATLPMNAFEQPKPPSAAPAAAAKRTVALGSTGLAPDGAAPLDPEAIGGGASVRPKAPSPSRAPNVSEPLQLQLHASDVLESADHAPKRSSRTPLFAGIGIAILIAGAIAGWIGTRGKSAPAANEPSLRGDGVLAQDSPQQAAPTAPAAPAAPAPVAAAPTSANPAPAAPAAAVQPAAAPTAAAPQAVAEEPAHDAPKDEPAAAKPAAAPADKRAPARKRRASGAQPASSAPVSADVREAREALRGLDSEPVLKIQRSDEGDFDAPAPEPPSGPDLPEPPAPEE